MMKELVPAGALIFAPMEGVTDPIYRETVADLNLGWNALACDFLRAPGNGRYPVKHLIKHIGKRFYDDPAWRARTMYQILTSQNAHTVEMVRDLAQLEIPWLDLNLGCPSNTVCRSGGGSFLLRDLGILGRIVRDIRQNFPGHFTCKVRVGWADGGSFEDVIKLLNDEGVEMITVHGRTREQMYKEPATWSWIAKAVEVSKVPVVGNGDVWCAEDARRIRQETGCHAVMVARGALKAPWFPLYHSRELDETPANQFMMVRKFLTLYCEKMLASGITEHGVLRQVKGIGRYMFDDLPGGQDLRRQVLLSQNYHDMRRHIGL